MKRGDSLAAAAGGRALGTACEPSVAVAPADVPSLVAE